MLKTVTAEKDNFITRIKSASGDIVMTEYSVFPGISLIYNDVNAEGGVGINAEGDVVARGDSIGFVGRYGTGPHLNISATKDGASIDPATIIKP